ncbi:MAG: mechanosensitive ion channel, partial [Pseudomonadota bacterium]|nr:mechanosensitive ion channel [Pseudomonadota bacterium]
FSGAALIRWFEAGLAWLMGTVFTPDNIVNTAMQVPAVVGTGFASWWVHDFVYPLLEERIKASASSDYSRRAMLVFASLIFPVLWALGLWISVVVSSYFGWPFNLIWVVINLLAAWIVIRLASILVRDPLFSKMITLTAFTVAVLNTVDLLNPTLVFLDRLAVNFGRLRVSLLTVLEGMFYLGVLLWVAVLASGVLERRIQRLPNLTPSVQVLIGKLFKASLVTLAIIVSLVGIGIDLTALAVFSGAVGVGIGFGLQKVVSNLISGIIILMDKSLKPGDVIQVGEKYGWISSLGARYVAVETRDGTEFLIPNEDIITKQVLNWTHSSTVTRLKVQVRVAFTEDIPKALALMEKAAETPARVLKTPGPRALILGFSDGQAELELRFWIRDAQNGIRNISSEVMLEIWRLYRENAITVPFPRRVILFEPGNVVEDPAQASAALAAEQAFVKPALQKPAD